MTASIEFEMGLFPNVLDEARGKGIDVAPKYIQAEVFDKRAVERKQVVFHDVSYIEVKPHLSKGEVTHTTVLDSASVGDYRSVIGYFGQTIMKELRLVGGYDLLYGFVKVFVRDHLFGHTVDLDSPNTLRNLSEIAATKTVIESFKRAINELTIHHVGQAEIKDTIKLRQTRPFVAKGQSYLMPKKSVFNRIIGDSPFELDFASFLDRCKDVQSFAKNYLAVRFRLDFVNATGDISNYYPDFIVKLNDGRIVVVETKGLSDLNVPLKMARLQQWCEDVNQAQSEVVYDFTFVDEEGFNRYSPKSFADILSSFTQYKGV